MRLSSTLAAVVSCLSLQALPAQDLNPAGQPFPEVRLSRTHKAAAIEQALGRQLPAVARWYGLSETALRQVLRRDHSILADRTGRLAYACHGAVAAGSTAEAGEGVAAAAPFPLDQTFALHSRPGAQRTLHLDFDGHTTSGTNWNTAFNGGNAFVTPAFDLDGNPAGFSDAELERIQKIWQRVAEDYAPFDVNVTTAEPGLEALRRSPSTDPAYGIRVCIGGSSYDWFKQGAGGVAYVGSFNWPSDTPCFVFPAQLGAGNEKYVAEAASHEVGHTLGLNHDGQTNGTEYYQGHGNWAPIMGVGYYRDVVQFSRGDYPLANNLQDDLAVMQTYGAPLRGDDVGDSILNATALPASDLTVSGVISTAGDADLFQFSTAGGSASFATQSPSPSPNLDVLLALYDGAGNLVTSQDASGSLPGALTATLAPGTYYLAVEGTAPGDPLTAYTDYGSLGAYALSGSVLPADNQPPVAAVSATPLSGTAPLEVQFSSAGSADPDGSLAGYNWDFGDGSAQVVTAEASHVYTQPGIYTASLVVYDNGGLSATATVTITVSAPPVEQSLHIGGLLMQLNTTRGGSAATATVTVLDAQGAPVAGAAVNGVWSGLTSGTASGLTNAQGQVSFQSKRVKKGGTFTFTVSGVSAAGYTYDAAANTATSGSISTPSSGSSGRR